MNEYGVGESELKFEFVEFVERRALTVMITEQPVRVSVFTPIEGKIIDGPPKWSMRLAGRSSPEARENDTKRHRLPGK